MKTAKNNSSNTASRRWVRLEFEFISGCTCHATMYNHYEGLVVAGKRSLMRIAIGVEYDGSQFRGWQIQELGTRTVQGCLEQALGSVAAHPIATICAGRTDAGVHSLGQVVHFDTHAERAERAWVLGGNSKLPADISVLWAKRVPDTFHARFSAVARRYRYVILNRRYRPALQRQRVAWSYKPLTAERMHEAAQHLLGEHDFSAFRGRHCQAKSPVRTVHVVRVERHRDYVVLDIEANAFLHNMVRNIAGVLLAVGRGERPTAWVREVLQGRNRQRAGITAAPEGLYLLAVRYAPAVGLPLAGLPLEAALPPFSLW